MLIRRNEAAVLNLMTLSDGEAIVDLFAGGASEAIFQATDRHPGVAVNHEEDAVQVHAVNHPQTSHCCQSVWQVKPNDVLPDRPIGLLWLSPDCWHFSRASGGRPKWKPVRSLPGVGITWATRRRPRIIVLENVPEFITWGPLREDGAPCPKRVGRTFRWFAGRLRGLGYAVEWRELCAADYGAPTTRKRLFLVARCDDLAIRWPTLMHARRPSPLLGERPWRPAAECIDWSIPARSIVDRERPLVEATLRRVAHGVVRYVLQAAEPFVVTIDQQSNPNGVQSAAGPLSTITTKNRHAVVVPSIAVLRNNATAYSAQEPLRTITASGEHHALLAPTLVQVGWGERDGQAPRVPRIDKPLGTIMERECKHALVAAFLAQHNTKVIGHPATRPLSTITTTAAHQQPVLCELGAPDSAAAERVWAFLVKYYGTAIGQDLRAPLDTVTTKGRFALVMVAGIAHAIVDIRMRMLQPHELAAAQGFPPGYVLDRGRRWAGDRQDGGHPAGGEQRLPATGRGAAPVVAAWLRSAGAETGAGDGSLTLSSGWREEPAAIRDHPRHSRAIEAGRTLP